ncbi:Cystathionine beta-lyase PatB [Fusobacterium necrogenes]|uniref:cysteine-S-conjugate beta-lyase n=1 Tax=Fusobacterium necrogenes TaxID=858 RepID=A0A377GX43_9FUSO|nr:MalY/PatB family protein [Fusobacterium necrogenes]STO31528.1 Cystathionine beta-lyase PatB [Fusobacterium necrogenes]
MKYNFDKPIDRTNTNSKKWNSEIYKETYHGHTDLLPLWVADMDFKVAQPILNSMKEIIEHGVLGYTSTDEEYYQAIINWNKKRKNSEIKKEWIVFTNGVVPAISFMIQAFTQKGDNILIQTPVYHPFRLTTENNERNIITNPLINNNGIYSMNFEDFEKKIIENHIKAFILCNPHNPVGRVWTKEDLIQLGDICLKHNVLIISDEIHSDLIFKEHKHCSFLTLEKKYFSNLIVCTAPSKTFNLAGIQTSLIIIPDENLRKIYQKTLRNVRIETPNSFGIAAIKSAYTQGEEWLEQVIEYLDENRKFIEKFLRKNLPNTKYIKPEGTYLAWIYLGDILKNRDIEKFFEEEAKVAIDYGHWFGEEGKGYIRLNFACPRIILEEALNKIKNSI